MTSLLETIAGLSSYQPTIACLLILCLMVVVQGFLAGALGLAQSEEVPGVPLKGNHDDRPFRIIRTYANSTENLPAFFAAAALAVVVGAPATVVNWIVALHLVSRLAYWPIYYAGIGKNGGGLRTIVYVGGLLANLGLVLIALFALIF